MPGQAYDGRVKAPDFPPDLDWLNVRRPLRLEPFDRLIGDMLRELDARGLLDRRPLEAGPERLERAGPLRFPGKLVADEAGGRLIVSDTGHDRIVVADLDGALSRVIAGPFHRPQGLALDGGRLYNHKIKRLDPGTGECRTLAGTGEPGDANGPAGQARFSEPGGLGVADLPASG